MDDDDVPRRVSAQERAQLCRAALSINPIDMRVIRKLAFQGLPDGVALRVVYWKLLLGFLPLDQSKWESESEIQRKIYKEWIQELILDPHSKYAQMKEEEAAAHLVEDVTQSDHPLNTKVDSTWGQYFKDCEMMEEIDKDVNRTFPHLHFFNKDGEIGSTRHYEALRRILFIYAKLNPGIKYVQGMNEILGPIYYVCARDDDVDFDNAESDAFHCFKNLMAEIRDNFCKTLDHSDTGVAGSLAKFTTVLQETDYEVWQHLDNQGMNPQFYSFRWITLLLSQEFDLPEVIQLWDSFFADANRFEFLLYCCCAMISCIRDRLLDNDFAPNLQILQQYPKDIEVVTIVQKAIELKTLREEAKQIATPEVIIVYEPQPSPQPPQRKTGFLSKFFSSHKSDSGGDSS